MNIKGDLAEKALIPYGQLRVALNGAKTLTPLFSALVGSPGIDSGDYLEKMKVLIDYNNQVGDKVFKEMVSRGVNGTDGAKAVIGRQVAEFVSKTWSSRNGDLPDANHVADVIVLSITSAPHIEATFEDIGDNTARIINESSIGMKIVPVVQEINGMPKARSSLYIGQLKVDQFVSRTIDRVMSLSNYITDALIGREETSGKDRQIALASITGSIGSVVAASMENTLSTMTKEFRIMDSDARKEYQNQMELHPEGILLDRVLEQSSSYIDALYPGVNLSQQFTEEEDQTSSFKAG